MRCIAVWVSSGRDCFPSESQNISTVHAHPTMHEAIHEAALATEGRTLHA